MEAPRPLLPGGGGTLSEPLASAYLAVVGIVWLATCAVVVLTIVTGRASWATRNLWIVVPIFVVIVAAIGVVRLVDQRLNGDAPRSTQGLRWLGLVYGSAASRAWRQLRPSSGRASSP